MSQAVQNYFSMQRYKKKMYDEASRAAWRKDLKVKLYLDKNLITLRPWANRWKNKRPKGLGWKDDC
tara:strand:- start:400 stop:597 length:198 start_codon:yes stop_codon:yes gene_type:complete